MTGEERGIWIAHRARAALAARILEQEHVAYPAALRLLLTHRWRLEGRRVIFQ